MGGRQGAAGNGPLTIPIENVRCSEDHIRKSDFSIDHLRDTIADAGLLQPILARKDGDGFVVIDGARRLAALRELGVQELIVGRDIVIDVEETEADTRFKQIIANVQREDLDDIELGQAFVTLKETFGYQYNEIAEIIGKTPHFVAAKVGLVKRLDPEVRQLYTRDTMGALDTEGTEATEATEATENDAPGAEKCIQNTFSESPYLMNVNVLEDIARVPREAQLAAYREIKAHRMDKDMAMAYLRTLKNWSPGEARLAFDDSSMALAGERKGRENVLKHVRKINREIEHLLEYVNGGVRLEPETAAEVKALVERLNQFCLRMRAEETDGAEEVPDRA